MAANSNQRIRLDFANLPLVEVCARVSFESPVTLTYATVNGVYDRLRSSFPALTEPTRFEAPPGIEDAALAVGPGKITGAVYTGHSQGLNITLQGQVIVARWVKRVGDEVSEYPRFPVLSQALWDALQAFREVAAGQVSRIVVANMSYVNFLRIRHSAPVLSRYFSDLAQVRATQNAKEIHKTEVAWSESDGVDLRYRLEQVTAKVADEKVDGYRLTTAAGTRLDTGADVTRTLDVVHNRLQLFFRDLISDEARKEWQLGRTAHENIGILPSCIQNRGIRRPINAKGFLPEEMLPGPNYVAVDLLVQAVWHGAVDNLNR